MSTIEPKGLLLAPSGPLFYISLHVVLCASAGPILRLHATLVCFSFYYYFFLLLLFLYHFYRLLFILGLLFITHVNQYVLK